VISTRSKSFCRASAPGRSAARNRTDVLHQSARSGRYEVHVVVRTVPVGVELGQEARKSGWSPSEGHFRWKARSPRRFRLFFNESSNSRPTGKVPSSADAAPLRKRCITFLSRILAFTDPSRGKGLPRKAPARPRGGLKLIGRRGSRRWRPPAALLAHVLAPAPAACSRPGCLDIVHDVRHAKVLAVPLMGPLMSSDKGTTRPWKPPWHIGKAIDNIQAHRRTGQAASASTSTAPAAGPRRAGNWTGSRRLDADRAMCWPCASPRAAAARAMK